MDDGQRKTQRKLKGPCPCSLWTPVLLTLLCTVLHVNSIVNTLTPVPSSLCCSTLLSLCSTFLSLLRPSTHPLPPILPFLLRPRSKSKKALVQRVKQPPFSSLFISSVFLCFPLLPILSSPSPFSLSSTPSFVLFPSFHSHS